MDWVAHWRHHGSGTVVGVALGLDVGERRIGVAKSDPTGFLASPVTTIIRESDRQAVDAIAHLVEEHGATTLVIGAPLGAAGETTDQVRRVQTFGRKLGVIPGVVVVFWDERYTTETASEALHTYRPRRRTVPTPRQREAERRRLDAAAAAVILQDFLDRHGSGDSLPEREAN